MAVSTFKSLASRPHRANTNTPADTRQPTPSGASYRCMSLTAQGCGNRVQLGAACCWARPPSAADPTGSHDQVANCGDRRDRGRRSFGLNACPATLACNHPGGSRTSACSFRSWVTIRVLSNGAETPSADQQAMTFGWIACASRRRRPPRAGLQRGHSCILKMIR